MRCAIYARVSTFDQEPENQLAEIRRYIAARGWTAEEYVDRGISGAKDRRPALDQLLIDARRRRFDVVVVWRLDRLGRNLRHLIILLEELQALGIEDVHLELAGGRRSVNALVERHERDPQLLSFASTLVALAATLAESLTGPITTLVTFRWRIVALLVILGLCAVSVIYVFSAKRPSPALQLPSTTLEYRFTELARGVAKLGLLTLTLAIAYEASLAGFFVTPSTPVVARVIGAGGRPIFDSEVMLLNLDREAIAASPSRTDTQTGLFVVDPNPWVGRPAYFRVNVPGCRETESITFHTWLIGRNAEVVDDEHGHRVLVLRSRCDPSVKPNQAVPSESHARP